VLHLKERKKERKKERSHFKDISATIDWRTLLDLIPLLSWWSLHWIEDGFCSALKKPCRDRNIYGSFILFISSLFLYILLILSQASGSFVLGSCIACGCTMMVVADDQSGHWVSQTNQPTHTHSDVYSRSSGNVGAICESCFLSACFSDQFWHWFIWFPIILRHVSICNIDSGCPELDWPRLWTGQIPIQLYNMAGQQPFYLLNNFWKKKKFCLLSRHRLMKQTIWVLHSPLTVTSFRLDF